jgi:hypothetical protein
VATESAKPKIVAVICLSGAFSEKANTQHRATELLIPAHQLTIEAFWRVTDKKPTDYQRQEHSKPRARYVITTTAAFDDPP